MLTLNSQLLLLLPPLQVLELQVGACNAIPSSLELVLLPNRIVLFLCVTLQKQQQQQQQKTTGMTILVDSTDVGRCHSWHSYDENC